MEPRIILYRGRFKLRRALRARCQCGKLARLPQSEPILCEYHFAVMRGRLWQEQEQDAHYAGWERSSEVAG